MNTGSRAMPVSGAASATAPGDFRLEDFLPYQLSVAANRVARMFARRYSEAHGLTIPEWRVLATVARFNIVSPTMVSEWTAMDKVKVSRAAAGLASRGLIRQSADPKDGRGRLLRMTRKGETVHRDIVPLARELEATLVEGIGRSQWAALSAALVRLSAHVQSIEGSDDGDALD